MAGEWAAKSVAELQAAGALLVEDGNHGENRPRPDEFASEGIQFIRAADMDGGRVLFESAQRINEVARQRVRKGIGAGGDVLLSHKGTVGKVAYVPTNAPPFVCSPQTTFWRVTDHKQLDRRYIYFFLLSRAFREQLDSRKGETDMADYVSLTTQRTLKVTVPPLAEQKAIAEVLGALDDKIELNRKMNATLEAMARALFQSWFVDFDPVRAKLDGRKPDGLDKATAALFPSSFQDSPLGPIPKGWAVGSILRQADLLSGGTPKTDVPAYWNGDVPWASAKDVSQCGEAFLVSTERTITKLGVEESSTKIIPSLATVVVARGATTGRLAMFGESMAMNQTCYGLQSKVDAPFALYCHARHFIERLVQGGHGSVFDTITTSTFEATEVLLASEKVLQAFDEHVSPLFQRVRTNIHQSRTLATARDTLLPKLLNGELDVSHLRSAHES
jgi:type I restriction enzyme S subunit